MRIESRRRKLSESRWRPPEPVGCDALGSRRRDQALALRLLASELTRAAYRFRFLSRRPLGWLLIEPSPLHLAENPFTLHLLLENSESLLNIVVANKNLQNTDPFELVG
jgi:hypothetical protein